MIFIRSIMNSTSIFMFIDEKMLDGFPIRTNEVSCESPQRTVDTILGDASSLVFATQSLVKTLSIIDRSLWFHQNPEEFTQESIDILSTNPHKDLILNKCISICSIISLPLIIVMSEFVHVGRSSASLVYWNNFNGVEIDSHKKTFLKR